MENTKKSRIPSFRNEDQEREYWAAHDSVGLVDWSKAERATFSRLRPSVRSISLRLPESLLERIKSLANKHDVPYQSLMKMYLSERVEQEVQIPEGRIRPSFPARK